MEYQPSIPTTVATVPQQKQMPGCRPIAFEPSLAILGKNGKRQWNVHLFV
jgi:hypothetical protein